MKIKKNEIQDHRLEQKTIKIKSIGDIRTKKTNNNYVKKLSQEPITNEDSIHEECGGLVHLKRRIDRKDKYSLRHL